MKSATQKRKLVNKKQLEFQNFVDEKIMPIFDKWGEHFDIINPQLEDDWNGLNILITIPYGDRMEPWLKKVISECYNNVRKTIWVIMGAKVNTNAWHSYVFPFADEIGFVRRGKRPAAYVRYCDRLSYAAFEKGNENIFFTVDSSFNDNLKEKVENALSRKIINLQDENND